MWGRTPSSWLLYTSASTCTAPLCRSDTELQFYRCNTKLLPAVHLQTVRVRTGRREGTEGGKGSGREQTRKDFRKVLVKVTGRKRKKKK